MNINSFHSFLLVILFSTSALALDVGTLTSLEVTMARVAQLPELDHGMSNGTSFVLMDGVVPGGRAACALMIQMSKNLEFKQHRMKLRLFKMNLIKSKFSPSDPGYSAIVDIQLGLEFDDHNKINPQAEILNRIQMLDLGLSREVLRVRAETEDIIFGSNELLQENQQITIEFATDNPDKIVSVVGRDFNNYEILKCKFQ